MMMGGPRGLEMRKRTEIGRMGEDMSRKSRRMAAGGQITTAAGASPTVLGAFTAGSASPVPTMIIKVIFDGGPKLADDLVKNINGIIVKGAQQLIPQLNGSLPFVNYSEQ